MHNREEGTNFARIIEDIKGQRLDVTSSYVIFNKISDNILNKLRSTGKRKINRL